MKKLWKPALLLAAVAVMVIGMLGSGAWFSDTKTTDIGTIKAGTIKIGDLSTSTLDLGTIAANMLPGEKTNDIVLTIENVGTRELAWLGDLQFTNSILKNVVYIDYAEMKFLSPNGNNWSPDYSDWGNVDNFIKDGKGYGRYPTVWGGPENLATLDAFNGKGGMTPETDKYEFMGALRPGYKYQLTLRFAMYEKANDDYQGAGPLELKFKVDATQINAAQMKDLGVTTDHTDWLKQQVAYQDAQFANGN